MNNPILVWIVTTRNKNTIGLYLFRTTCSFKIEEPGSYQVTTLQLMELHGIVVDFVGFAPHQDLKLLDVEGVRERYTLLTIVRCTECGGTVICADARRLAR